MSRSWDDEECPGGDAGASGALRGLPLEPAGGLLLGSPLEGKRFEGFPFFRCACV